MSLSTKDVIQNFVLINTLKISLKNTLIQILEVETNIRSTGMLATFLKAISFNIYSWFGYESVEIISRIKHEATNAMKFNYLIILINSSG